MKKFKTQFFILGLLLLASNLASVAAPDAASLDFFEKKIRPIFVEHCYKCHSSQSEKVKGGLWLDTQEGLRKGGDTGPALVPGKPEQSLFIKAVHYTDENLQMPPKGKKLSAEQIAALETWVKMGAPDPRISSTQNSKLKTQNPKNHWAFQPVKNPPLPKVKNKRWIKSSIDNFVLAKLESKGIKPSPPADKRTLIRRATFDLTGLPPTPTEVENFLKDKSPEAFAKVVDRLLASPRYGERWGRHWLDVARYADTKGYMFMEERRYPYSYTYRDYVIRSFNQDLPFDKFVVQQLAADQLPLGENKEPLAAMGFLTVGRRFLNNQSDIIDDRIDVVTRGLMGLTVACARCHDHKFDPIPTQDYYSLYGIFASSTEPKEYPQLGSKPKEYGEYLAEKKKRAEELRNFKKSKVKETLAQLRQKTRDYLLAAYDSQRLSDKSKFEQLALERKLDVPLVQQWISHLENFSKKHHPVFAPWFALAALPENEFSARAKDLAAQFVANKNAEKPLNPLVAQLFTNAPTSIKQVAELYEKLFSEADKRGQEMLVTQEKLIVPETKPKSAAAASCDDINWEEVRQALSAADGLSNLSFSELYRFLDVAATVRFSELKMKIVELSVTHPGAPPRAMSLEDKPTP
ncbi:MAG: DUF1549 domain-containing protein, partial [Limisphaerales bacterium]